MSRYVSEHLMTGSTFGSIVSWTWDRARMRFVAAHKAHTMIVQFHKVGGRYNRTLPDGDPNPNPSAGKSYWTAEVDHDHQQRRIQYKTSAEAKRAAVAEYVRRLGKD